MRGSGAYKNKPDGQFIHQAYFVLFITFRVRQSPTGSRAAVLAARLAPCIGGVSLAAVAVFAAVFDTCKVCTRIECSYIFMYIHVLNLPLFMLLSASAFSREMRI